MRITKKNRHLIAVLLLMLSLLVSSGILHSKSVSSSVINETAYAYGDFDTVPDLARIGTKENLRKILIDIIANILDGDDSHFSINDSEVDSVWNYLVNNTEGKVQIDVYNNQDGNTYAYFCYVNNQTMGKAITMYFSEWFGKSKAEIKAWCVEQMEPLRQQILADLRDKYGDDISETYTIDDSIVNGWVDTIYSNIQAKKGVAFVLTLNATYNSQSIGSYQQYVAIAGPITIHYKDLEGNTILGDTTVTPSHKDIIFGHYNVPWYALDLGTYQYDHIDGAPINAYWRQMTTNEFTIYYKKDVDSQQEHDSINLRTGGINGSLGTNDDVVIINKINKILKSVYPKPEDVVDVSINDNENFEALIQDYKNGALGEYVLSVTETTFAGTKIDAKMDFKLYSDLDVHYQDEEGNPIVLDGKEREDDFYSSLHHGEDGYEIIAEQVLEDESNKYTFVQELNGSSLSHDWGPGQATRIVLVYHKRDASMSAGEKRVEVGSKTADELEILLMDLANLGDDIEKKSLQITNLDELKEKLTKGEVGTYDVFYTAVDIDGNTRQTTGELEIFKNDATISAKDDRVLIGSLTTESLYELVLNNVTAAGVVDINSISIVNWNDLKTKYEDEEECDVEVQYTAKNKYGDDVTCKGVVTLYKERTDTSDSSSSTRDSSSSTSDSSSSSSTTDDYSSSSDSSTSASDVEDPATASSLSSSSSSTTSRQTSSSSTISTRSSSSDTTDYVTEEDENDDSEGTIATPMKSSTSSEMEAIPETNEDMPKTNETNNIFYFAAGVFMMGAVILGYKEWGINKLGR